MLNIREKYDLKICELVRDYYEAANVGVSLKSALCDAMLVSIAVGLAEEGEDMPSLVVMAKAVDMGVSTTHAAYEKCESLGYLKKAQGKKSVVIISKEKAMKIVMGQIHTHEIPQLAAKLHLLGITPMEGGEIIKIAMAQNKPEKPKGKKQPVKKPDVKSNE